MNIPALVIERSARLGDNWRNRYPTLTLHTVRRHHTSKPVPFDVATRVCLSPRPAVLYQSYPTNWPVFTPRDKIADWIEMYASMQDLVVWTSTEFRGRPMYDKETSSWDVTITREGFEVKLCPAHIVLATGTLGEPNIPSLENMESYRGVILHSQHYVGGAPFAGKRAVVVGAGNSSIDVCQDLFLRGAESVTMIQRSSTCVMGRDYIADVLRDSFPENVPMDVADMKWASYPFGLLKRLMIANQDMAWESQTELHDKLRKGGIRLNMGPEGQGLYLLVMERGGGE